MIEEKSLRILCFGDSLTEGYTNYGLVFKPYSATLKTVLSWELDGRRGLERWEIEVVTRGVSGEMVGNMGERMRSVYSEFDEPSIEEDDRPSTPTSPTFATSSKPYDLVIFLGGTNDLGRGRSALDILKDIQTILDIPLATGAKVLLMTVPECRVRVGWLDERRGAINSGLKEWARERGDMEIFDLCEAIPYHTMKEEDRNNIWDDGLHFTEAGYEMIGTLVGNRIVEILEGKPGWLG